MNTSGEMATPVTALTPAAGPTPAATVSQADYAGYVFVPLFIILGLVGNSLTIRVMLSRSFRTMPVSKLLIALSLSDTCVNLLFPFNKPFVKALLGTDLRALSVGGCRLFFWAYRYFKTTSSWMVVFVTVERFIAVCFPIKAKELNTTRNAYVVIGAVYGGLAVYIGYWCSFADQLINGKCIPNTQPAGKEVQAQAFLVIGLCLYAFIPVMLLLLLNTMIVCRLVALKRKKTKAVGPTTGTKKTSPQDKTSKTTIMLLSVAITFVILVTPNGVSHLVGFVKKQNIFETTDPGMVFFREISQVMEQMNNSINFFLYVMCSKRFRERVLSMFTKRRVSGVEHTGVQGHTVASNISQN